jgi:type I restriction enzyme M protein
LPATLWFFNRKKANKDEILFIDARNIFTQIDRVHRKFSNEQISNLAIISRLYEGKNEEFWALIDEYIGKIICSRETFENALNSIYNLQDERKEKVITICEKLKINEKFAKVIDFKLPNLEMVIQYFKKLCSDYTANGSNACKRTFFENMSKYYENLIKVMKELQIIDTGLRESFTGLIKQANIGDKETKELNSINVLGVSKAIDIANDVIEESINYWVGNLRWLLTRFPNGEYQDITGVCKVASIDGEDGIKEQDYSLNPGRYVGVVIEEDGMTEEEFKAEMLSLNEELTVLNREAEGLERKITENLLSLVNG